MTIVPSGNLKKMETQTTSHRMVDDFLSSIISNDYLRKEAQLLDENVDNSMMSPDVDNNIYDDLPDEQQNDFQNNEQINEQEEDSDSSLQKYIFKLLEQIGVPPRIIDKASEKIFKSTEDLTSGTMSGFYMIPTYTQKGKITENKAKKLAHDIGSKFALIQKFESSGSNYKISFTSGANEANEDNEIGGTSFDKLLPGSSSNNTSSKSASTIQNMIKESRENFCNKIIKNIESNSRRKR